jgi:hypothetical protein
MMHALRECIRLSDADPSSSEGVASAPLTRFLGLPAHEVEPHALLDVPQGPLSRAQVLSALKSRLAQVAAHDEAQSHEASEVRVLLHAAAARDHGGG